jgi:site-specific DNA-cytosine methylase
MQVVDFFCGVGGFSAGVLETGLPVLGVDNDDLMVRLWAANTKGTGKLADLWQEVDLLMRIGCDGPLLSLADISSSDSVHQPVHIHISPPCTTLSKARRNNERAGENAASGMAYLRESFEFLRGIKAKSWSIETVSTPW